MPLTPSHRVLPTVDRNATVTEDTPSLTFLLLAGLPLVIWVVADDPQTQAVALLVGCLLIAAVRLVSRGQRLDRAFTVSNGTAQPIVPRKVIGSALLGVVVFILAGHEFPGLTLPVFMGCVAFGLSILAFGVDACLSRAATPKSERKGTPILSDLETALTGAEARVHALGQASLGQDVTAFADQAVTVLHRIAARDRSRIDAIQSLLTQISHALEAEVTRLEESDCGPLARRRFATQIAHMREKLASGIEMAPSDAAANHRANTTGTKPSFAA